MDEKIKTLLKSVKPQYRCIAISVFVSGMLAHGMGLFNKYSMHDDIEHLFGSYGIGYSNGRWMWAVLTEIVKSIWGNNVSLPLWGGIISFIFIILSACLLVQMLEVKSSLLAGILGCFMVVRPIVAGVFGYMFVLPYYMFAEFLGFLGAYIIYRYRKPCLYIMGILMMACATGIYQAFIPSILCVMLFRFVLTIHEDRLGEKTYIREGFHYIVSILAFVALYAILTKVIMWWKQTSLISYKGLDHMWDMSHIGERTLRAYYKFFVPEPKLSQMIYPGQCIYIYYLAVLFCGCIALFAAIEAYKKNKWNGILVILSILVFPLCACFIYVMCESEYVAGLMLYGQIMPFIYMICLIQQLEYKKQIQKVFIAIAIAAVMFVNLNYIRLDNASYVKAEFMQQRAISWHTTLITRIKSIEGYRGDLPITYINKFEAYDASVSDMIGWDFVKMPPYENINLSLNNFIWSKYINYWCGFGQAEVASQGYEELQEVKQMPFYPDDGSIKIIDGVIVVKFGRE